MLINISFVFLSGIFKYYRLVFFFGLLLSYCGQAGLAIYGLVLNITGAGQCRFRNKSLVDNGILFMVCVQFLAIFCGPVAFVVIH